MKSLWLTWLCYTWLFFMSCSPYIVATFSNYFNLPYQYNNTTMINYFVIVGLLLGGLLWISESGVNYVTRLFLNKQTAVMIILLAIVFLLQHSITLFHGLMLAIALMLLMTPFNLIRALTAFAIMILANTQLLFLFIIFACVIPRRRPRDPVSLIMH